MHKDIVGSVLDKLDVLDVVSYAQADKGVRRWIREHSYWESRWARTLATKVERVGPDARKNYLAWFLALNKRRRRLLDFVKQDESVMLYMSADDDKTVRCQTRSGIVRDDLHNIASSHFKCTVHKENWNYPESPTVFYIVMRFANAADCSPFLARACYYLFDKGWFVQLSRGPSTTLFVKTPIE